MTNLSPEGTPPTAEPDRPTVAQPTPFAVLANPIATVALVVALLLGVGGTLAVQGVGQAVGHSVAKPKTTGKQFFSAALRKCALSAFSDGITLGDSGDSLSIDAEGEKDSSGLDIETELCVLKAVKTPDSTIDKMDATRALDGRQSDSWRHVEASWSYHPDNGLDVILQYQ